MTKKQRSKLAEESAATTEKPKEPAGAAADVAGLAQDWNQDEVAVLAYKIWQERGCPVGSDQEDWFRAENELKNRKVLVAGAS